MRTLRLVSVLVVAIGLLLQAADTPLNLQSMDLEAVDRSCRPCDDFYQFAIGKWNADHPIPANQRRWGKRWAGADGNVDVLHDILETAAQRGATAGNERLIGNFYAACSDTATIDRLGVRPIAPRLASVAAITTRADLERQIAAIHRTAAVLMSGAAEEVAPAFRLSSAQYRENPDQVIARLSSSVLGLPDRDYYLKDDAKSIATRDRYLRHIERLLTLAGVDGTRARAGAARVLVIETEFARERLSRVDLRDPYKTNTHLPVSRLRELAPHFDWSAYARSMGLAPDTLVNVADPVYLKGFDRQLEETSIEDWRWYLTWSVVRANARDLAQPFRDEMFDFVDRFLGGQSEAEPRWKYCVGRTDALLGDALGRAYVERVFPPAAKIRMQEMVANIRAALHDSIAGLEWMTDATKRRAFDKLEAMNAKVGYPDVWRSYQGLVASRADYFGNVQRTLAFNQRDDIGLIGRPTDRTRWRMTAPTSNAYSNSVGLEVVFPAGILVAPMFDMRASDAANYGGIGVVIGHEISHQFDDAGSQYDSKGRLRNWWSDEDRRRFSERASCVVEQFDHYFIEPGVPHNGKLVLGESIGDLAGARIAYLAYMKSLEGKPRPANVGGFTPEQQFFLAWGQARGDAVRIEEQRRMILTDNHPVGKWRINGPFSNMPEFRAAFGCADGDAMVRSPQQACRVW
jgi:endothelin-converting enzyme/putative endopeptidase